MYIRYAFFEGRVKDGCAAAFAAFVRDRLVPLWTTFPGAEEVRVLRQVAADDGAPRFEMVLAIRYPSLEAIEIAVKSDVRARSRAETQELVKMFDGRIFHNVFKADEYPVG